LAGFKRLSICITAQSR